MASSVLDSNCNCYTLGYLGGYDGNTKINGVDFAAAFLGKVIGIIKAKRKAVSANALTAFV